MLRAVSAAVCFLPLTLPAATIHVAVVENQTGRPMARTVVKLEALAAGVSRKTLRTDRYGLCSFIELPQGAYLLTASRVGFVPFGYGQRFWDAAPTPVFVEEKSDINLQFRLRRYAAISGFVWDENEIGFPNVPVFAYIASATPKIAGHSITDDTGRFRIGGLPPGKYFVRTDALPLEEGEAIVPTYHRETSVRAEAEVVPVELEEVADLVNIFPTFGELYSLQGRVMPPAAMELTLTSDLGRKTVSVNYTGSFEFTDLPAGEYELFGVSQDRRYSDPVNVYTRILLHRNEDDLFVPLRPAPEIRWQYVDAAGNPLPLEGGFVVARRLDLDGTSPVEKRLPREGHSLNAGRWELHIEPPKGYYVAALTEPAAPEIATSWPAGWSQIELHASTSRLIKVTLSARTASIQGRVVSSKRDPAPGAPVFLLPVDAASGAPLSDCYSTRARADGTFLFESLPPATYRLFSSFDYRDPRPEQFDQANSRLVALKESASEDIEIDLYQRP
jgi:hypothetical protein